MIADRFPQMKMLPIPHFEDLLLLGTCTHTHSVTIFKHTHAHTHTHTHCNHTATQPYTQTHDHTLKIQQTHTQSHICNHTHNTRSQKLKHIPTMVNPVLWYLFYNPVCCVFVLRYACLVSTGMGVLLGLITAITVNCCIVLIPNRCMLGLCDIDLPAALHMNVSCRTRLKWVTRQSGSSESSVT